MALPLFILGVYKRLMDTRFPTHLYRLVYFIKVAALTLSFPPPKQMKMQVKNFLASAFFHIKE